MDSMPFAVAVRKIKELNYLLECNKKDNYYQINMFTNYQHDYLVFTFSLKNSKIDTLYFTHFIPGSSGDIKKNKYFYLVKSRDNQSLICYYNKPKLMKITKNNENLVNYFDKTIWTIQDKIAENKAMDGDTYLVYGRKNNQAITLYRNSYGDTLFNTNMKALINLCKIKDFKLGIFK